MIPAPRSLVDPLFLLVSLVLCVCVCERERESVCVYVCVYVFVCLCAVIIVVWGLSVSLCAIVTNVLRVSMCVSF